MKVNRKATIGQRMKEAPALRGLNQSELCDRTGISSAQISSYLSGRYEPSPENVAAIAEALGVSEIWLRGYDLPAEEDRKVKEATVDMEIAIKNMQKALAEINNALACLDNAFLCIGYAKGEFQPTAAKEIDFGKTLRKLRESRHTTQAELAKAVQVKKTAISNYETNRRKPSFKIVRKLAEYFEVDEGYLIRGGVEKEECEWKK